MTDTPYRDTAKLDVADAECFANALLDRLHRDVAPHAQIVVTGVGLCNGEVANFGLSRGGERFCVSQAHEGRSYPGTGDIFASVLLGDLMKGEAFESSCRHAAEYVAMLIRESSKIDTPERMGVALEHYLYLLVKTSGKE